MTRIEAAVEALRQLPEDQVQGFVIGWQADGVGFMAGVAAVCEDGFGVFVPTGYWPGECAETVQDVIPFSEVLMVAKVVAEGEVADDPVESAESPVVDLP